MNTRSDALLTGDPAVFEALVNDVLRKYLTIFFVYLDDI